MTRFLTALRANTRADWNAAAMLGAVLAVMVFAL